MSAFVKEILALVGTYLSQILSEFRTSCGIVVMIVLCSRFAEALRAQMKERIAQEKVDLPPLCCCGDGFWDAHPDTCANNCIFYHNPKGTTVQPLACLSTILCTSN